MENTPLDPTQIVLGAVDRIEKKVNEAAKIADVTKAITDATTPLAEELKAIQVKQDEADKRINSIDEKAGALKANTGSKIITNFGTAFAEAVKENFDSIRKICY
jgi:hypothetical protein